MATRRDDWITPNPLVEKAEEMWGQLTFDLAASRGNAKADMYCSEQERNYLTYDFSKVHHCHREHGWCNPPFSNKDKFLQKIVEVDRFLFRQITVLLPNNARETEWWYKFALSCDEIVNLTPRPSFELPEDTGVRLLGGSPKHSGPKFGCAFLVYRKPVTGYYPGYPKETYLNWKE
jgi:phage N-6-adenine-methyltransferase